MKKRFGHALRFPNVTFKLVVALYMLYYIFGYKQMTFGHALRFPNVAWLPPPHQVNTPLYHIVEDQYIGTYKKRITFTGASGIGHDTLWDVALSAKKACISTKERKLYHTVAILLC